MGRHIYQEDRCLIGSSPSRGYVTGVYFAVSALIIVEKLNGIIDTRARYRLPTMLRRLRG